MKDEIVFFRTTDKGKRRIMPLRISQILYIEAMENYLKIVFQKMEKPFTDEYIILKTLKCADNQLSKLGEIIQLHRSYLINLGHIAIIEDKTVTLSNGKTLPIGETHRDEFMSQLNIL